MYVYEIEHLEYRAPGRVLAGTFPYGKLATISDRGTRRKESIAARAFKFAVDDDAHEIDLLRGHSFDSPLASKRSGTLELEDRADGLAFEATLPPEARQPTWMRDTVLAVRSGLIRGVSPGFRVPPTSAVSNAETLIPEPGNPGVFIRQINQAVLYELSLVTRPSYAESSVDIRSAGLVGPTAADMERYYRML